MKTTQRLVWNLCLIFAFLYHLTMSAAVFLPRDKAIWLLQRIFGWDWSGADLQVLSMGKVLGVYMFVFGLFAALPLVDPNRYRGFVYPVITFFVLKALLMSFYAEVLLEEMHVSFARLSVQTFVLLLVAVGLYFSRPPDQARVLKDSSLTL